MAIRTAPGGAVRWARSAVIALCAALAVLVHHETAAAAVSTMHTAMHGMSVPGRAASSVDAPPMGPSAGHAEMLGADPAAPSSDDGSCASDMQHCATAGVDTVKLPVPPPGRTERIPQPYGVVVGPVLPGVVGRAPPDLSVLSQLRV
jgi:hypothetical protein